MYRSGRSDSGWAPELAENGDVDSLAAALRSLMNDASKRKIMGQQAAESMKQYEPEKIWNEWEALLSVIAGKNNGLFSFFEGLDKSSRTLIVIIPHEDDEINLAGTVIYHARKLGIRVICVFTTNGDWKYPGLIRMKEAIQALSVLGVPERGYCISGLSGWRGAWGTQCFCEWP